MATLVSSTGGLTLRLVEGGTVTVAAYDVRTNTRHNSLNDTWDFNVSVMVPDPFPDRLANSLWLATCTGDALAAVALADRLREIGAV